MRSWTEDTSTYTGKAWNYVDIICRPRPLQKPHPPIYYGATSPDSPAMVARRGWNLALSRPTAHELRARRSSPIATNAPSTANYRAQATRSWCAISTSPTLTSRRGKKRRRRSLAFGNSPPTTSGAATACPPMTCQNSRSGFRIFPVVSRSSASDEWGHITDRQSNTVIKKPRVMIETARPDSLVGMFSFGGLKHEQVMHSIDLFADQR